jgi:hypothetical protein
MSPRNRPSPEAAPEDPRVEERAGGDPEEAEHAERVSRPDLSAIPVAGVTPRRVAGALAGLVAVWIVITFARQAGAASEAAARASELRLANAELAAELSALEAELVFIQRPEYVAIEMRGYRLGRPREIPFTLAPDAPALAPDAPGSASVRLGEEPPQVSPLESWLSILFGPQR